ncbi:hypothetical protein TUN199_04590 [Pyrenophora tritici-repentis]|nr:hypothetical protein Alg215_02249 [Pyrenophora tritici-repentis]KAI0623399.1 hypothetical protein TUN199_04590 [Pyrenophora tritici-repentis]KAI1668086.1 hypothetical protein L13192_07222 [Pyrenophora tritici-repentis]
MRITIVSIVFPALLVSGQDVCCGGKGTGGYVNAPPNWCEQQNPNAHMYCCVGNGLEGGCPQAFNVPPEWCCAWVAGDYIGARPNWCQDNNGVSLCCIPVFPWNGGPDGWGACQNPAFPYRRMNIPYRDGLNPISNRATCTGYDGGRTCNDQGYGMCIKHGST